MKKCNNCDWNNADDAKFCNNCGKILNHKKEQPEESVTYFCPECGKRMEAKAEFCGNCGFSIKAQSAENKIPELSESKIPEASDSDKVFRHNKDEDINKNNEIFCPECGRKLETNAVFCGNCGYSSKIKSEESKISISPKPEVTKPYTIKTVEDELCEKPEKSKESFKKPKNDKHPVLKNKLIIVSGTAIVLILMIVFVSTFLVSGKIKEKTINKLEAAVKDLNAEKIFEFTESASHDKSLTSYEVEEKYNYFKKYWKNSTLYTYLSPSVEIVEVNKIYNSNREDFKMIALLEYHNPSYSVNKDISSPPYIRRVKKAKITFKAEKSEGNKDFTHLSLYDFEPLVYFDDYDNNSYRKGYKKESSLSSKALAKKILIDKVNSSSNISTRSSGGDYWLHHDDISEYIPPQSESYISSGVISFRVYNTLKYTSVRVKIKINYTTNSYQDTGWDCNSGYFPRTDFTETVYVTLSPESSKIQKPSFSTRVKGRVTKGLCFGSGLSRSCSIDSKSIRVYVSSVETK